MNGARYSYLKRACDLVEKGRDIVVVSEDYAAPMFDEFRQNHPSRFLSVGIAEQNGVAVACGLALAGKYPIVYGCAPFPLTRAIDQLKSAVAGMRLPITVLNSGVGFGVPEFGATHFNMDDIAMVRGIPGMRIVTPTDNVMAEQLADFSLSAHEPLYVRFDKNSEGELYQAGEICFEKGFHAWSVLNRQTDIVLISCGSMVREVIALADKLACRGIYAKVMDLYSLPFDGNSMLEEIGDLPVVSIEEHIPQGGIGTAVLETLNTYRRENRLMRLGVRFMGGYPNVSGKREYFMEQFGLSTEQLENSIQNFFHQQEPARAKKQRDGER